MNILKKLGYKDLPEKVDGWEEADALWLLIHKSEYPYPSLDTTEGNLILKQEQSRRELLTGLIQEIYYRYHRYVTTQDKKRYFYNSTGDKIHLIERTLSTDLNRPVKWSEVVKLLEEG